MIKEALNGSESSQRWGWLIAGLILALGLMPAAVNLVRAICHNSYSAAHRLLQYSQTQLVYGPGCTAFLNQSEKESTMYVAWSLV